MPTTPDVHEALARIVATVPQRTGTGDGVVLTCVDTPLGAMIAGARPDGLCLFEYSEPHRLDAQIAMMRQRFQGPVRCGESPYFDTVRAEIEAYFSGSLRAFTLPLVFPGTPFQERVWTRLLQIPYGETISYERLARDVGSPRGQRAVGLANGTNRLAILVPCHRVINKSGKLGGYGGLLWRKDALLTLERGGLFAKEIGDWTWEATNPLRA